MWLVYSTIGVGILCFSMPIILGNNEDVNLINPTFLFIGILYIILYTILIFKIRNRIIKISEETKGTVKVVDNIVVK